MQYCLVISAFVHVDQWGSVIKCNKKDVEEKLVINEWPM